MLKSTVSQTGFTGGATATETNSARNKRHYDAHLFDVAPHALALKLHDVDAFLDDASRTDTSWAAMYYGDFRHRLRGARVLEVGSGDGLNALLMAALGADVTCVDISQNSAAITLAAEELGIESRVHPIVGDFAEMSFTPQSFDIVAGKAFLHHLTHDQEARCLARAAAVLRPGGEARFTDPAVNSRWLDTVRWLVRVPGRPSRLNREAFRAYLSADPHPLRDNSSAHYAEQGARFFGRVEIVPIGGLERFHRLLPDGRFNRRFRRAALRVERWLPRALQLKIARGHTLLLKEPRHAS